MAARTKEATFYVKKKKSTNIDSVHPLVKTIKVHIILSGTRRDHRSGWQNSVPCEV